MSSLNLLKVEATSAGLTNAAYAVGEVLGNEMQWDMGTGTYGLVVSAKLTDTADVIGAVDLYLFDRSVTFGTDNAVPSISDADVLFYLGKISFPTPDDLGGCRVAAVDSIGLGVKANASGIVYGRMVTFTANAAIPSATAIQVDLVFSLDV